jgi:hypothetical protein
MAQIINDNPGIGALLGTGLGQGISSGLQQIAQLKTNQMLQKHQQREAARGLQSLGFSPQEATQFSLLPQELQGLVIKNYLQGAENAGLGQALGGVQVSQNPQSEESGMQELLTLASQPQLPKQQGLMERLGIAQPGVLNKKLPTEKVIGDLLAQQSASQQQVMPAAKKNAAPREEARPQQEERNSLADILRRPRLTPEHRLKIEALRQQRDIAEKKLDAKRQEVVDSETKPVYDQIQKEYKASKDSSKRLDRMEALIKTGKLDDPRTASYIKAITHGIFGVGLDVTHLLEPESQEFEKLSADFVKNAKDYFGNRLTDADLNAFLKTIPSLLQTDEGKMRVIRNLRNFNNAALIKKRASDRILEANGGRRPRNYEQLIEKMTEADLDRLAERFVAGL